MSKLTQKFNQILDGFLGIGSYGEFEDDDPPVVLTQETPVDSQTQIQNNQLPATQESSQEGSKKAALWETRRHNDLVIGSTAFGAFPIPLRQPRKNLDSDYEKTLNKFTYRIVASREYGYPFGQDSLILLLIEDMARKTKNRKVCLGSIWELLKRLGLGDGKQNYLRFLDAIKRLAHSKFSFFPTGQRSVAIFFEVFEAIHLKGITEGWKEDQGNFIVITESHYSRIMQQELPYDLEVFRRLSHSAGASRMYKFVATRAFTAATSKEGVVYVSVEELLNQLGCENYARKRDAILKIKTWKAECDEALMATGMGHLPLTVDDHGRVSIFPKHLVPGVSAVIDSKAVVQRPSHAKHKMSFKPSLTTNQKPKEFDFDWVLEKELKDYNSGKIEALSQAASRYSAEKHEALTGA